jgi:hypothetical protein
MAIVCLICRFARLAMRLRTLPSEECGSALLADAPAAPSSLVRRLLVACHVQVSSAALAGTFKFKLALRLEDGDQAGPGRAGQVGVPWGGDSESEPKSRRRGDQPRTASSSVHWHCQCQSHGSLSIRFCRPQA